MSGGSFTDYSYADTHLANVICGVDAMYGCGNPKYYKQIDGEGCYKVYTHCNHDDYLKNRKYVLKHNPMDDKLVSELVYDVLCLIHSKDYAVSGDTSDDQYEADLRAFKDKWCKGITKPHIKDIIDANVDDVRKELYKTFNIEVSE